MFYFLSSLIAILPIHEFVQIYIKKLNFSTNFNLLKSDKNASSGLFTLGRVELDKHLSVWGSEGLVFLGTVIVVTGDRIIGVSVCLVLHFNQFRYNFNLLYAC